MSGDTEELRLELERARLELAAARDELSQTQHALANLRAGTVPAAVARDEWLRSILAHSPDVISILSPEGRILFLSRSEGSKDPETFTGRESGSFLPPDERVRWLAALQAALATGQAQRVELRSQGEFWWDTRIVPTVAADGKQVLLSIGTNVTAKRRAEREAHESAEKLRLALAASHVGLWHWDVLHDEVLWDDATTSAFGQHAPPRTRAEFLAIVHPEDRARVAALIARALETGVYPDLELRALAADGGVRSLLIRGEVTADPDGRYAALRGAVLDITSQKLLEEQLRQAVKMDAVGQLAGGIAHDFNNLMLVILASVQLAAASASPERRDEYLGQIKLATERAAALTRQLLLLSRRQPLSPGDVDLNGLVSETLRLLRRVVPASVEIDFVPGHQLNPVAADRGQIEQVLINLCVNARDAMPGGGRLTIETENVFVNGRYREAHPWAVPGRYVLLTVSDTGTGMTPEVQRRVFEPFFTTKGPGEGTGLGLSVAYGIVRQHQGMLHVYSQPGQGSTFKVYLPVGERRAAEVGAKLEERVIGGDETILVAEDDEAVRGVVSRILLDAGYRVIAVGDGEQAVAAVAGAERPIDLVLLDAVMPRTGGIEALGRMRAAVPRLKAILTSGYSEAARDAAAAGAGDLALLEKPYSPDVLLRAVRRALDR